MEQFLAEQFELMRQKKGWRYSQSQWAKSLGVSHQSLSQWMNGYRLPTGDNVHVLADKLGPKVYDILNWQIAQVKKHLSPDGYFMQHDEIRVQGWDEACLRRKLTPGEILADNAKRCTAIIRKANPGKDIYVWSDMFDPFHNAKKTGRYYLVRGDGPWYGSWKGLDKDVIVVNWHGHAKGRAESLKHFASRGHKQILAGYYDGPPERIAAWLKDAAAVDGVIGVMYTTWRQNYDDLEKFAEQLRKYSR